MMFLSDNANLQKIKDKILYYPMSERDIRDPVQLFRDFVSEFWFIDVCYQFRLPDRKQYMRGLRDMNFIGEEVRGPLNKRHKYIKKDNDHAFIYVEPAFLVHKYIYKNREIKIIFRRDIDYTALFGPSPYEIAKNRLGIFFFRGTSNEGGSDHSWVYSREQRILDLDNPITLIDKLVSILPDGGLIVTDVSNSQPGREDLGTSDEYRSFCQFTNSKLTCEEAFELAKPFTDHSGNKFASIGHAGQRNGPTLIWQIQKENGDIDQL